MDAKTLIAANEKAQAVNEAVIHHDGQWPDQLMSGVMFWNGHRITLTEFLSVAVNWNRSKRYV